MDDLEKLWHHTFYNELRVAPEETPIILTEPPGGFPSHIREKMCQIMFETFSVPAFLLINTGALALASSGKTTGLVITSGRSTTISAHYELSTLHHTVQHLPIGGNDVTTHLVKLLEDRGYSFTTTAEREIVRDMKEKLCYVAIDFEAEQLNEHGYELPDGTVITIDSERYRAPEIMFQPSMIGLSCPSLVDGCKEAIASADEELVPQLLSHTVLSGGNTMFNGLSERLHKEMPMMKVIASPERKFGPWIGGSILGSLSQYTRMCITKSDYDEIGPSLVNRYCL